jgi:actin related protein 2/3 complex subunit 1A/1B
MAYPLDICDAPITCHAWNKDRTMLAICPNTCDLIIYKVDGKKFEVKYTLSEHTQVISSVDWSPVTNRIVTCSHDRNAYVWTLDEKENIWRKDLVLLKLKRAATYVRWSPDGQKFLVATGTNKVRLCEFDTNENWWKSYNLAHKDPTGLTCEWLSDNQHFVLATTTRHCFYMTTDTDEAEENAAKNKKNKSKKPVFFNDSWQSQGWTNAAAVSPSGNWIAYTSQDSYIRFIKKEEVGADDPPQHKLNINGLPLLSIAFVNDTTLIGAGFDCSPRLFFCTGDNWEDLGLLDIPEIREAAAQKTGGLAAKMAAFGGKAAPKSTAQPLHNNIILGLRITEKFFSTCANDGRVCIWPFDVIQKHFAGKKLF